jgi:septum formation protein
MILLASTSRYRRALLEAAGISHLAVAPRFDEDHTEPLPPEQLVVAFARAKAESIALDHPGAVIVGSDQIPELDGQILTKPGNAETARAQLRVLSGRPHRLLTAVAVHAQGRTESRLVVHHMHMRALTAAQIDEYVARDQPFDCAGSYRVEAAGALLFDAMDGPDHTAIVGLPLTALASLCFAFGVDLLG